MARASTTAVTILTWAVIGGCHHATDPTPLCYAPPPEGTSQAALYKVLGPGTCGTGGTSVTPFTIPGATFATVIRFRVRGAKPSTVYFVQRAAEVGSGRPANADGVCQRADGLPWTPGDTPVVPAWVTFPLPYVDQGPKKTLITDAAGDASSEFEYRSPGIPAGAQFDVEMRLVDDETTPTSELRSGCMIVVVR